MARAPAQLELAGLSRYGGAVQGTAVACSLLRGDIAAEQLHVCASDDVVDRLAEGVRERGIDVGVVAVRGLQAEHLLHGVGDALEQSALAVDARRQIAILQRQLLLMGVAATPPEGGEGKRQRKARQPGDDQGDRRELAERRQRCGRIDLVQHGPRHARHRGADREGFAAIGSGQRSIWTELARHQRLAEGDRHHARIRPGNHLLAAVLTPLNQAEALA